MSLMTFTSEKPGMKIVFYHPNGQKYFSYMNGLPGSIEFRSYPYFRRLLGYHKGDNQRIALRLTNKLPKRADVAIYGLAPFDLNVLLLPLQKLFYNSKIIYHTSFPYHNTGRFFAWFAPIFRLIIRKYVDCIVCTPPTLMSDLKVVYPDVRIEGIDHHIPDILERQSNEVFYDVGFIGEKSFKKGFDRFLYLAKRYTDLKFIVLGSGIISEELPENIIDLGYVPRSDIFSYMQKTRIVLLPSRKVQGWEELYSMVVVEAIKCNCQVYASDHVGPRFLFRRHYHKMVLVPDEDYSWQNLKLGFEENMAENGDDFSHYSAEELNSKWLSIFCFK